MRRRGALLVLLLGVWMTPGRAQVATPGPIPMPVPVQAPRVSIGGRVATPSSYTLGALAAQPAVEVQAAREGGTLATFVGPLLWPLLEAAKPVDGTTPGANLQHTLVARSADGYAAVLAIGEIDPQFEGKPVIIAYKQDGVVLGAPRLVVPGDRRAGRNVRDLVSIEVQ